MQESIPRNRFPGGRVLHRVVVPVRQAARAGGINFLEPIPGLLKRLQILAPIITLHTWEMNELWVLAQYN
jgi:hypothetical protein